MGLILEAIFGLAGLLLECASEMFVIFFFEGMEAWQFGAAAMIVVWICVASFFLGVLTHKK